MLKGKAFLKEICKMYFQKLTWSDVKNLWAYRPQICQCFISIKVDNTWFFQPRSWYSFSKESHVVTNLKESHMVTNLKESHVVTNLKESHMVTNLKESHMVTNLKESQMVTDLKASHIVTNLKAKLSNSDKFHCCRNKTDRA